MYYVGSLGTLPTYSLFQQLMLTPDQLELGAPDRPWPGSPEVVLVKVEDDLLPGRPAVLRNAAPQVEGVKVWRNQRLQPCNWEEGGEPVGDEHHLLVGEASSAEEGAVHPPNSTNASLVQWLLCISQRKVRWLNF